MNKRSTPLSDNGKLRNRVGISLTIFGLFLFILGAKPELFGLDFTPIIGFVQITVFLFGLAVICVGGYICLDTIYLSREKSIIAEIGLRLIATGYVISLASGMADVLGLGTRPLPSIPFFGYWQARGVLIGELVIIIGFIMMIPFRRLEN